MGRLWRFLPETGKERKADFTKSQAHSRETKEKGVRVAYFYLNSPLLHDGIGDDYSYNATFAVVLPPDEDMDTYLRKNIPPEIANRGLIVADVGGVGRELMKSLREVGTRPMNEFAFGIRRSIALTLQDPGAEPKEDAKNHHYVLVGNILDESIEGKTDKWLDGEKVDVVFERLGAGLIGLPDNPFWMAKKLSRWYQRASDSGILFIQTPVIFNFFINAWVKMLKRQFPNQLEVRFHPGVHNGNIGQQSALLIRKLPGAPKTLPFLDIVTVQNMIKARNEIVAQELGRSEGLAESEGE